MEEPRARVLVKPISVGSLVARFAIAGLVALVFVAAFTAFASRRVGTEQAIDEAKRVAFVSSAGIVSTAARRRRAHDGPRRRSTGSTPRSGRPCCGARSSGSRSGPRTARSSTPTNPG